MNSWIKNALWLNLKQHLSLIKVISALAFLTACSGNVGLKLGGLSQGKQVILPLDRQVANSLDAQASSNLITNGDFENGLTGWDNYGNASISSNGAYSGVNVLKVGTGAGGAGQYINDRLKAGATYRLSGYAKLVNGSEYAHVSADFTDSSGNRILNKTAVITGSTYNYYSVDFVFPANSANGSVGVWKNAGTGTLSVDALKLEMIADSGTLASPAPDSTAPATAVMPLALTIVDASIATSNLTVGQMQIVKVSLKAGSSFQDVLVSIRILNSGSQIVFEKFLEHVNLPSGSLTPYQLDFQTTTSLVAGTYTSVIGVWNADWSVTHLYENIGSFQVTTGSSAPAPVPTAPADNPTPVATTPAPTPVAANGYPFGSRLVPYVAGIQPSLVSQAIQDAAIQKLYNSWKQTLSTSCPGYYVKFNSSYATVSEGIGYGMLITAFMEGYDSNARSIFDGLFKFARNHPAYNVDPNLMDWRVNNDCSSAGDGWNAMDGDLDIAMGLLMADRQWGSNGSINYLAEGIKTINALKNKNMSPAGYTMGGPAPDLSRTSDYMISHFRAFRKATGDGYWDTVINKSFELMTLMQSNFAPNTGLVPDFIVGLPSSPAPSPGSRIESLTEGFYAWNGCRIPMRLGADFVMTGDQRSKDVAGKIMDFLNNTTNGNPTLIAMGYKLDGTPLTTPQIDYTSPAFGGPALAGAMVDSRFQTYLNKLWTLNADHPAVSYYDYELQMLSMIVASGNWWNP